jgi:hypothetical protein
LLTTNCQTQCNKRLAENSAAIADLLGSAVEEATRNYKALFEQEIGGSRRKELSQSEMKRIGKLVSGRCVSQLETLVKPTAWIFEEAEYKSALTKVDANVKKQQVALDELNQAAISQLLTKTADERLATLQAIQLVPFPDTPSTIMKKISQESAEMIRLLRKTADSYEYPDITSAILAKAGAQVETFAAEKAKANKDLFEEYFGSSTRQCIRVRRRETQSQCHPLCADYFMPGAAYSRFVKDAHDCLDQIAKKKRVTIPGGVLEELLPLWWEEDGTNQTLLYVIITALLGVVVALVLRGRSGR